MSILNEIFVEIKELPEDEITIIKAFVAGMQSQKIINIKHGKKTHQPEPEKTTA